MQRHRAASPPLPSLTGANVFRRVFDFIDTTPADRDQRRHSERSAASIHSVADFYAGKLFARLTDLGFGGVRIHDACEVVDAIRSRKTPRTPPFPGARQPILSRWLRLTGCSRPRARFIGKVQPVHFLGELRRACLLLSGRKAPVHPGGVPNLADWVVHLRRTHEVSSCMFWPGNARLPQPAHSVRTRISRASGFTLAKIRPDGAVTTRNLEVHPSLTSFGNRRRPTRRCSNSCKAATRRRPTLVPGTARRSSARNTAFGGLREPRNG